MYAPSVVLSVSYLVQGCYLKKQRELKEEEEEEEAERNRYSKVDFWFKVKQVKHYGMGYCKQNDYFAISSWMAEVKVLRIVYEHK